MEPVDNLDINLEPLDSLDNYMEPVPVGSLNIVVVIYLNTPLCPVSA